MHDVDARLLGIEARVRDAELRLREAEARLKNQLEFANKGIQCLYMSINQLRITSKLFSSFARWDSQSSDARWNGIIVKVLNAG